MTLILIGFMGSGKSTVAGVLSENYVDLDLEIVRKIGMPIAQFFEKFGEAEFRVVEHQVFSELIDSGGVIATGGGIVESPENRELLALQSEVVYLKANFSSLWQRINADKKNVRPLAQNGAEIVEKLYEKRKKSYQGLADLTVEVADKSPEEIAQIIFDWQKGQKE
ncbi:shikimate kinase [Lactococcus nasutitermitis]|uniref:Shikimate kinase n=1 Tax=Lactococcus nasutitermitis TaxID=1652957 RepID=A0ABV9JC78_9LACT|nr:shikimate kinase [Lactococcus nasutitermitis]